MTDSASISRLYGLSAKYQSKSETASSLLHAMAPIPIKTVSFKCSIPTGASVTTPYGVGVLEKVNTNGLLVVGLNWNAKAYLSPEDVIWKKKLFEMSSKEKLDAGIHHKNQGAGKFMAGEFQEAIRSYEVAMIYFRQSAEPGLLKTYVAPCLQNVSMCKLKLLDYHGCIASANDSLSIVPDNYKAIFFVGKAKRLLGEFKSAQFELHKAATLSPSNLEIRNELALTKVELEKRLEAEKNLFGGLLLEPVKRPASSQAFSDHLKRTKTDDLVVATPVEKVTKSWNILIAVIATSALAAALVWTMKKK